MVFRRKIRLHLPHWYQIEQWESEPPLPLILFAVSVLELAAYTIDFVINKFGVRFYFVVRSVSTCREIPNNLDSEQLKLRQCCIPVILVHTCLLRNSNLRIYAWRPTCIYIYIYIATHIHSSHNLVSRGSNIKYYYIKIFELILGVT